MKSSIKLGTLSLLVTIVIMSLSSMVQATPAYKPKKYSAQCLKTDGTWVNIKFLPSTDYVLFAARNACKEQLGVAWAGHEDAVVLPKQNNIEIGEEELVEESGDKI